MALTDKLTAIGDAIRSKTGGTDLIPLVDMPAAIEGISGGGGGAYDITSTVGSDGNQTLEIVDAGSGGGSALNFKTAGFTLQKSMTNPITKASTRAPDLNQYYFATIEIGFEPKAFIAGTYIPISPDPYVEPLYGFIQHNNNVAEIVPKTNASTEPRFTATNTSYQYADGVLTIVLGQFLDGHGPHIDNWYYAALG